MRETIEIERERNTELLNFIMGKTVIDDNLEEIDIKENVREIKSWSNQKLRMMKKARLDYEKFKNGEWDAVQK